MFQRIPKNKAKKISLIRSMALPCWIIDCNQFSVDAVSESMASAIGVKALAANMWAEEAKFVKEKAGLVAVSSLTSSVPNIVATVAQSLKMNCSIIVPEMNQDELQKKVTLYPDCVEAIAKGAVFLSSGSHSFKESDQFAEKWIETHSTYTLIPPGMHTKEIFEFTSELVNRLKYLPFIDTIVTVIGSGFSLASIINGMANTNLSHDVIGVAVHPNDLTFFFKQLALLRISAVQDKFNAENYMLSREDWHCQLSIKRRPEPLLNTEIDKYSRLFMPEGVPLDPDFEAKCVPIIEDLLSKGHKPLLWNLSCSPTFAQKLLQEKAATALFPFRPR